MSSAQDIQSSEKTYEGFVGALKWVVPAIGLLVMFIVFLIA
ncbi:aa3-type cytochrome c oxidase subunit IV [Altericroceibacterium endophyticum]|uniref:Aa3-type cytochrome c oxidase subunit IV n=1 Tax=Altericroceibacterium endophyticum TaxID=1808508 RepID=A0A6I4T2M8_9SPHN|nr:aa3-type cytochrome c oxidase subunit IV [Altericroceibacterium endophyticum]MXO64240.1 aa3-type cytochrome c oxidase subunit IV [Altericroceibacterium endophyticum]